MFVKKTHALAVALAFVAGSAFAAGGPISSCERGQIGYDISIVEVQLGADNQQGIQWNKANFSGDTGGGALGTSTAWNLGSTVSADAVLSFLATQGKVQIVTQPKISQVSGGETSFSVGDKTPYVSKITTAGKEYAEVGTGVALALNSCWTSGTVRTALRLKLTELLALHQVAADGSTIVGLSQLSEREYKNALRTNSGDTVVLAGIISNRAVAQDGSRTDTVSGRKETVVILRSTAAKLGD